MIRVVAVDDHPLVLKAIVQELENCEDITVVGTAPHGSEVHRLVRETSPDVVVLDLGMSSGVFEPANAVKTLRSEHPDVKVLVLTGYDDAAWVRRLIEAGASGYVLKSDDLSLCLGEGVRELYQGHRFYSPAVAEKFIQTEKTSITGQELSVLKLVAQGLSNNQISHELGLSSKTIANHLYNIYRKFDIPADGGVNQRIVAINAARDAGLLG